MTAKPITPHEIDSAKAKVIPPMVIEAFNDLIALNWDGQSAVVSQKEVVESILIRCGDSTPMTSQDVMDKGYLNIETLYENAGWEVKYDKPGFNESYTPTFTFTRP